MELELEASTAATRIDEPGALIDAFARAALVPHLSRIFDKLGFEHRVLRYELYDHASKISFASVKAGLTFDPSVDSAPHELPSAEPTVALRNRSNAPCRILRCSPFSSSERQPDGTLIVDLYQANSERALPISGLIAGVTLLLLGAGRPPSLCLDA